MSASSIDPDILAAFNDGQPTASSHSNIDPDIAAAFAEHPTPSGPPPHGTYLDAIGETALSGITGAAGSLADALTGANPGTHDWAYKPTTIEGKALSNFVGRAGKAVTDTAADTAADIIGSFGGNTAAASETLRERIPEALGATGAVTGALGMLRGGPELEATGAPKFINAQDAANQAAARTSGGAAATGVNVSRLTPETRAELVRATQAGEPINQTALIRHADAESLPMPPGDDPLRLRKGQATGDQQQISDEKNLRADPDTRGILSDSITDQDEKLVSSMGEVRRQATPDVVQMNNSEHGQAAVDSIKNMDNQRILDIRSKYKALADANGGAIPIDSGSAISGIDAQLQNKFLTKTAKQNGTVSEVMDSLRSGQPMSFEAFENARSGLAEVQRAGGRDGVAAGIVHDALENMPLPANATPLKALADTARSAAASRFEDIRQNPAYAAVVEDNVPKVNGLHKIGTASPLADSFMNRFALGNGPTAAGAYIGRLKGLMQNDPGFSEHIEGSALNNLRDAAGIDINGNGSFRSASYRNAVDAMAPKSGLLLKPDTLDNVNQLQRVAGYVNDEGKASTVNRSNTALTLQRFGARGDNIPTIGSELANYGTDIAASHLGPVGVVGKRVGQTLFKNAQEAKSVQALKDAKLKFATDATKSGAGIGQ